MVDAYQSIRKRMEAHVAEGDFSDFVEPFDFKLLERLPDEGASVGGLYQLGETVNKLSEFFTGQAKAEVPSKVVFARLASLRSMGLCRPVKALGSNTNKSWQRTQRGKEVLELWLAQR